MPQREPPSIVDVIDRSQKRPTYEELLTEIERLKEELRKERAARGVCQ